MTGVRHLIVNADDYGLTAGVSEGIRRAHRSGVVTSTTAMMNFPLAMGEVARAVAECPDLGLGVHLVVSAGAPVRPAAKVASLVRPDASFAKLTDWTEARWQAVRPDQLRDEWRAQIDLFVEAAGRSPTHLDSHHHLSYAHPLALQAMLTLADELRVPVRNPLGFASQAQVLGDGEKSAQRAVTALAGDWAGIGHPEGLVTNYLGRGRSAGDALALALRSGQVAEAMCHPGLCDDVLRALSSFTDGRERETEMLSNPDIRTHLAERGIELATFAILAA
ncbi:MAG: ChbG/HpnK family deacetylase [Alphaproteobacteria bacterium]|nr:ChbG/HpnK family deacetylase [Alphaproteobacteria bacterium]